MATLKFTAFIELRGVNPYVHVRQDQAAKLQANWHKPMPVLIRINGHPRDPWHINMMPAGDGSYYLYLHGDVRRASSTKVGDNVMVEIDFDDSYRSGPQHPMPPALATALAQSVVARANWDALPASRQKEIVRYFARLKSAATIARNVERALSVLSAQPGHFMGRDWRNGS